MRKLAALLMCTALMTAPMFSAPHTEDKKFETLAKEYLEGMLRLNPESATQLGDHRYDRRLDDRSLKGVQKRLQFTKATLKKLAAVNPDKLSQVNRIDLKILKNYLEAGVFETEVLREHEWNPLVYNPGDALYMLVARDFAPVKTRLLDLKARMAAVPQVIAAAKANLKNPPKVYTETAIAQNEGNIGLVQDDLEQFLDQAPELKAEFKPLREATVKAFAEYGAWLKSDLLPRSNGDFRIGDKNFRMKLKYTLESDLTKEELLKICMEELRKTQDAIYETALPIYKSAHPNADPAKLGDKKHVVKTALDKLAEDRPTNDTILDLANKSLASCTKFVRDKNLMTVPDEPVKIIVMPEFQRGFSVAYCDPPGALEKNGETFYAIAPTPKDWTKERVESFFREYNNYMTENLTVHEAMPGHYLQLAHANKFKAPTLVRAIFQNGTFTEGWATYAEQLMVEHGYGGPQVKMQQLKMRLRLIINAIIDQKIHTEGMTEKEAMDLMMNEGFQEEGEAAGKWRRACLSSCQLSTYFVGNVEMNRIRQAHQSKHGADADLKTMHDLMLSFGSPAPKYVKELMGL